MPATATRSTATERREDVVAAAFAAFADTGLDGHLDRGHRARGRDLAAVPLPPLRHQEAALPGRRRALLRRDRGSISRGGRGRVARGGEAPHGRCLLRDDPATAGSCGCRCRPMRLATTRTFGGSSSRALPACPRTSRARPDSTQRRTGALPGPGHVAQRDGFDGRARLRRAAGRPRSGRDAWPASLTRPRPGPFF